MTLIDQKNHWVLDMFFINIDFNIYLNSIFMLLDFFHTRMRITTVTGYDLGLKKAHLKLQLACHLQ